MMKTKPTTLLMLSLLAGILLLALPAPAHAQEVPPPTWQGEGTVADDDILVFEPQLFFKLPFAQGFQISFNFGISIQVPRRLTLISEEAYNFFLRFRSYVIPGGGEAPLLEE